MAQRLRATAETQGVDWHECKEGDWQAGERLGCQLAKETQKVRARKEC